MGNTSHTKKWTVGHSFSSTQPNVRRLLNTSTVTWFVGDRPAASMVMWALMQRWMPLFTVIPVRQNAYALVECHDRRALEDVRAVVKDLKEPLLVWVSVFLDQTRDVC